MEVFSLGGGRFSLSGLVIICCRYTTSGKKTNSLESCMTTYFSSVVKTVKVRCLSHF